MINLKHFRDLFPYYLSFIFRYGFSIIAILSVLYFNIKGFSFFEISIFFTIGSLSVFFFEIPTSVFADKYGRKTSVLISFIATIVITLMYPFVSTPIQLWVLAFVGGFFATFASGSETSLIVDNIKKKEKINEYYTTRSTLFAVTGAISGLLGYVFFKIYEPAQKVGDFIAVDLLWFVYAFALLVSTLIFVFYVKENKYKKSKEGVVRFTFSGLKHIWKTFNLRLIFIWNFLFFVVFYSWGFLYLPYLDSFGIKIETISLAYIFLFIVGMPFAKTGQYFYRKVKHEKPFLIGSYSLYFIWSLLVLINLKIFAYIYWYFRWNAVGFFKPTEQSFKETFIPAKSRSTINSMQSATMSLAMAVGNFLGGVLIALTSAQNAIFYSSFLMIPVILIVMFLRK